MHRYFLTGFGLIIWIFTLAQNGWASEFQRVTQSEEEPSFSEEKEENDIF